MRKLSKVRTLSNAEFVRADLLTRLKVHLLNESLYPLSSEENATLNRLTIVYTQMQTTPSKAGAIRILKMTQKWDLSRSRWYELCRQAGEIFGDINEHKPEVERRLLKAKFNALGEAAEAAGDLALAYKCYDRVLTMEQYDKPDTGIDPDDLEIGDITFTTDSSVLEDIAEDVDYETVVEDGSTS